MAATVRRRASSEGWGASWKNERSCGGGGGKTLLLTLAAIAACALIWGLAAAPASAQSGSCPTTRLAVSSGETTTTGSWGSSDCLTRRTGRNLWVDHYAFTLTVESHVELELSSSSRTPLLVLSTAAGAERHAVLGSGAASSASISAQLSAGSYRIQATKSDTGRGAYQLGLSARATGQGPIPTAAQVRARLARALFGPDILTNHDYNSYKARPDLGGGCRGYDGGHSGWDAQTQSVAGAVPTRDEPFFSLTTGTVIVAGGGTYNTIAVYDAVANLTTLYAHARRVDVRVGQLVRVGTRLGIQGNAGLSNDPTDREHVHVEVRSGRRTRLGCGAIHTIDPFNYLYRSVTAAGN